MPLTVQSTSGIPKPTKKGTKDKQTFSPKEWREHLKQIKETENRQAREAGKDIVIVDPKTKQVEGFVRGGNVEKRVISLKKKFGKDTKFFLKKEATIKQIEEGKVNFPTEKPKSFLLDAPDVRKVSISPRDKAGLRVSSKSTTGFFIDRPESTKISLIGKDLKKQTKEEVSKLQVPDKFISKIKDKKIQSTIDFSKQEEERIKKIQEQLRKQEGKQFQTFKVADKTFFTFDKQGFAKTITVSKKKPGEKVTFSESFEENYAEPLRILSRKIENKLFKSSNNPVGAYLKATESYTDNKGKVKYSGGKRAVAAKIITNVAIGFVAGKVFVKTLKLAPKFAKSLSILSKPAGILYVGGVPFRVKSALARGGKSQVAVEFAGDLGFMAALKVGKTNFGDIKRTKIDPVSGRKILNKISKGKISKKKPPKIQKAKFKELSITEQKNVLKYYIEKYKKIPKNLIERFDNIIIKKRLSVAKPKKVKTRVFIPKESRGVLKLKKQKQLFRREVVRTLKSREVFLKNQQREIKAQKNRIQLDYSKNLQKTNRLLKEMKSGLQKKAIRTDHVIIDGKKKYFLPITQKYSSSRKKYLIQIKTMAKIDKNFNNVYENFRKADIMERLYKEFNPQNTLKNIKQYNLIKETKKEALSNLNKNVDNSIKLIRHDLKSYAIQEYGKYQNLGFGVITESKFKFLLKKFGKDAKSIKDILFSYKDDKGRIVITKDKKIYVFKNVDTEVTGKTGQVQIVRQEVLVEVRQAPKQQQQVLQKVEQVSEQKPKQKTQQLTQQMVFQEQKQKQKPKQATKQQQVLKQKLVLLSRTIQKPKQILKQKQILKTIQKQQLKQQQILKQKVLQSTKLAVLQKSLQKTLQKQKVLQMSMQKQAPQQKLKQKLIQQSQLQQKLIQKLITVQALTEKPPLIPKKLRFKINKAIAEAKKKKKNLKFKYLYSPTLSGLGEKAGITTGRFSGFEMRGTNIVLKRKPIKVKQHKRKTLKNKPFVRRHRRKKARK